MSAALQHYRACGWPVSHDSVGKSVLVRTGSTVDAIVLDPSLSGEVLAHLEVHMLAGPVLSYRVAPDSMVFLTTPATPVRRSTLADLEHAHVTLPRPGSALALPMAGSSSSDVWWVRPPRPGRMLAPWQAVVSSVRVVLTTGDHAA
ncbi:MULTISPECIES: hypothetical protein [Amycolatopsis]|uniref:Uncharacterized protein n=1 Tax=Amycolatopsis albidoflavus TaxID=102226 RepID=A0ABW5I806_9PSEU